MQSLVKYFISLLFALLINLIPGRLALEQSEESVAPGVFELPAALCAEDIGNPAEQQNPQIPGKTETRFIGLEASCS